jgi:glycerate 2-kinase
MKGSGQQRIVGGVRVLAAVDHFGPGTSATDVARAVALGVGQAGSSCVELPLSTGGSGFLAAFGAANRRTLVMGPLGDAVEAPWRMKGSTAVIESGLASGLQLVGGPEGNDPIAAGTHGTGELVVAAAESGAKRIIIGVGGNAGTDGGLGAIRAVFPPSRLRGVRIIAACDVNTPFVEAADAFGAAKGATPAQIKLLRRRLERLIQVYRDQYEVDVSDCPGSGAGGGLAGGLLAIGAELLPGATVVSDELDLAWQIEQADLVITAEAFLDEHSFVHGVVGMVHEQADKLGVPVVALTTQTFDQVEARIPVELVPPAATADMLLAHLAQVVQRYVEDLSP